ncbi:glycosyltransferase [Leptolyngbya sp. CCNP1308]|uniref:glycosyltransferase n=1 Tax=Leptolyngbya sp. CCNP1308 TaxID=3110255 RepID=UPI002B1EEB04|nr:glycosyltransferase [Leptolyngbya sp. CCNP1308]MEA5452435.1 glycosyltransferase [Leptolyngbya sp. CCNP1308]
MTFALNPLPQPQPSPVNHRSAPLPRRRVLIVSPHFPPVNAPDHQRVRTALPYLAEFGWEAEVLTINPATVPHPQDPLLSQALPAGLPVHATAALPKRVTQLVGLGNVGWRGLPYLAQAGNRLLAQQSFDLVFFSTTIFPVMILGPYWRQRFGVPFAVDFQDPWRVNSAPAGQQRPGGRLKYAFDKSLAAFWEPRVMRRVSQVVSVSPAYPEVLQQRYPWLQADQFAVLPFGAPEADFEQLPNLPLKQTHFDTQDGRQHWVYVGRGGPDMALALRGLFRGLAALRSRYPNLTTVLHLHFIGTSYAPPELATKTIEPIAIACGVADLVTEHPQRVPYFEAQKLLTDSDAVLLIGSADSSYTASKLYPAVLAKKPILAIFHADSSVVDILRQTQAGQAVTFDGQTSPQQLAQQLIAPLQTLLAHPRHTPPATDWGAFAPYTAQAMTKALCQVFDRAVQTPSQPAEE